LTLFIRTLEIPVQCLRHIINTHLARNDFCKSN
jgi:hypothetical protein